MCGRGHNLLFSELIGSEHNILFRYRTSTTLLKIVAVLYRVTFKKLPYAYILDYMVTIRVWFLLLKICTCTVFICIWVLKFDAHTGIIS